jgi:hypothetical protein
MNVEDFSAKEPEEFAEAGNVGKVILQKIVFHYYFPQSSTP